jgi:hypothetical protein
MSELHILLLDDAPTAELLSRCMAIRDRASQVGNSYAAWVAALRAALVCLLAGEPINGLEWSDHMIDTQLAMGNHSNAAAAFAVRANLLAAAGAARQAMRLYAATRVRHESIGMPWPRAGLTRTLVERVTGLLDRRVVDQARAKGQNLTLADLAAGPSP